MMRGSEIVKVVKLSEISHRIRCYDNPAFYARYTVVFIDRQKERDGSYQCVALSAKPFNPQGIGFHCDAFLGLHLGHRVPFEKLPRDCRRFIRDELEQ